MAQTCLFARLRGSWLDTRHTTFRCFERSISRDEMNRRAFVRRAGVTAAAFGILKDLSACAPPAPPAPPAPVVLPGTFTELRDRFFLFHLNKNPVTSTYLGGDGYSPTLADANTRLRDYRQSSIDAELKEYRD